jgi:hydrogenase maturation protease
MEPVTVLVGTVSELFQSDLDAGRYLIERLADTDLGPGVRVESLHYGAIAVAQTLEDLRPGTLVLASAVERGRRPGDITRYLLTPPDLTAEETQVAVGDAVTGYVSPDLLVEVAAGLGALPSRVVVYEVEPVLTGPGDRLSAEVDAAVDELVRRVRVEVRRVPLLDLAEQLRGLAAAERLADGPALGALHQLLDCLRTLEVDGRWGAAFAARDRLRLAIAAGGTSEGMDHLDWGLWWALIEELDRLAALEVKDGSRA